MTACGECLHLVDRPMLPNKPSQGSTLSRVNCIQALVEFCGDYNRTWMHQVLRVLPQNYLLKERL